MEVEALEEIQQLITSGQLKQALEQLKAVFKEYPLETAELLQLTARLLKKEKDLRKEIISYEDAKVEENKIRYALLNFLREQIPALSSEILWHASQQFLDEYRKTPKYAEYANSRFFIPPKLKIEEEQAVDLPTALSFLNKSGQHFLIKGQGGLGKTHLLTFLWEAQLLNHEKDPALLLPIPIFVPLANFGQSGYAKKNYIIDFILKNYIKKESQTGVCHKDIYQFFNRKNTSPDSKNHPLVYLLLDALNEVRAKEEDKKALYQEIGQLSEQFSGIKILLTSRGKVRQGTGSRTVEVVFMYSKHRFITVSLEKMPSEMLKEELSPIFFYKKKFFELLRIPLYFNLFKGINQKSSLDDVDFMTLADTRGTLLYNYLIQQLIQVCSDLSSNDFAEIYLRKKYLLVDYLPSLVLNPFFDKNAISISTWRAFHQTCAEYLQKEASVFFNDKSIAEKNAIQYYYPNNSEALNEKCTEIIHFLTKEIVFFEVFRDAATNEIHYQFINDNYKDFFLALTYFTRILWLLSPYYKGNFLEADISLFFIDDNIAELIANLLDGYYQMLKKEQAEVHQRHPLDKVVDLLRGKKTSEFGVLLKNILSIYNQSKGSLATFDFSRLDLNNIDLSFYELRDFNGEDWLTPKFNETAIKASTLLGIKHRKAFQFTAFAPFIFSPSGKYFISHTQDIVIVWNNTTNQALLYLTLAPNFYLCDIFFLAEEQYVLIGGTDSIAIYNIWTYEKVEKIFNTQAIYYAHYLTDNNSLLFYQYPKVQLYNLPDLTFKKEIELSSFNVPRFFYQKGDASFFILFNDKILNEYNAFSLELIETFDGFDFPDSDFQYTGQGNIVIQQQISPQKNPEKWQKTKALATFLPLLEKEINEQFNHKEALRFIQIFNWRTKETEEEFIVPVNYKSPFFKRLNIYFFNEHHCFDLDLRTYKTNYNIRNDSKSTLQIRWAREDEFVIFFAYLKEDDSNTYGLIDIKNDKNYPHIAISSFCTYLDMNRAGTKLVAIDIFGYICEWDLERQQIIRENIGRDTEVQGQHAVRYLSDGSAIIVAYADGSIVKYTFHDKDVEQIQISKAGVFKATDWGYHPFVNRVSLALNSGHILSFDLDAGVIIQNENLIASPTALALRHYIQLIGSIHGNQEKVVFFKQKSGWLYFKKVFERYGEAITAIGFSRSYKYTAFGGNWGAVAIINKKDKVVHQTIIHGKVEHIYFWKKRKDKLIVIVRNTKENYKKTAAIMPEIRNETLYEQIGLVVIDFKQENPFVYSRWLGMLPLGHLESSKTLFNLKPSDDRKYLLKLYNIEDENRRSFMNFMGSIVYFSSVFSGLQLFNIKKLVEKPPSEQADMEAIETSWTQFANNEILDAALSADNQKVYVLMALLVQFPDSDQLTNMKSLVIGTLYTEDTSIIDLSYLPILMPEDEGKSIKLRSNPHCEDVLGFVIQEKGIFYEFSVAKGLRLPLAENFYCYPNKEVIRFQNIPKAVQKNQLLLIPDLDLRGCSFRASNVQMSDDDRQLLRTYGAVFDLNDLRKQQILKNKK